MAGVEEHDTLFQSVKALSQEFTDVINTIPAKYYFPVNDKKQDISQSGKKKKVKLDKKLLNKKAKLHKLDPSKHKSVEELQEEIAKKESEDLDSNEEHNSSNSFKVSSVPSSSSLEELREKLHSKMAELRGKRKLPSEFGDRNDIKKNRIEQKSKDSKKKKISKEIKQIKSIVSNEKELADKQPVKNDRGDIVFSKFDFANGTIKKKKKKNVYQMLEIAEKKKEKLKKINDTDTDKANDLEKTNSWNNALKKAEGVKLKDDPKLLKKTIKRKEKQKEKSKKKWEERLENVEKAKQEKQKIRKQHLKERKEGKSKGKKQLKKKKKPGF